MIYGGFSEIQCQTDPDDASVVEKFGDDFEVPLIIHFRQAMIGRDEIIICRKSLLGFFADAGLLYERFLI